MLREKNHVTPARLTLVLLAAIAVFSVGCGGSEQAASSVASIADVEAAATPAPDPVDDPPEDATQAQDPESAETSADPTNTTDSADSTGETGAGETGTSEDAVAEDATDEDMALAFVVCVREAGFDQMPDPTVNADGSVQLIPPGQAQLLNDPDFQGAAEGCVNLIEEATFFAEAPSISDFEDDLLAFAQCLRDNGLDVDDPDLSKFVPGQGARMFGDNFDPQDPANADAIAACSSLLPNAAGN